MGCLKNTINLVAIFFKISGKKIAVSGVFFAIPIENAIFFSNLIKKIADYFKDLLGEMKKCNLFITFQRKDCIFYDLY